MAQVKHLKLFPPDAEIQVKIEGMILRVRTEDVQWDVNKNIVYLPTDVEYQVIGEANHVSCLRKW